MIIAKVMNNNKIYITPVFAVCLNRMESKVVVFDDSFSELIVIDLYKKYRNAVLFIKYDYSDFLIQEDMFKSYWNDRDIFKTIKRKKYSTTMLEEAKDICNNCNYPEFTKIENEYDLEALEMNVGSFHDAYILGMNEKGDTLEILFDTTWGAWVIFRCKGIIENNLKVGDPFCYCDMKIDQEGYIELSFDSFNSDKELLFKAEIIEFKSLFDKQNKINQFEYTFSKNELIITNDKEVSVVSLNKIDNNFLDFKERDVIGYFKNDDIMITCSILFNNYVLSFNKYIYYKKNKNLFKNKWDMFRSDCEKYGIYFDDFPFVDYGQNSVDDDFGNTLHIEKYSKLYHFLYLLKYSLIVPLIWSFIWLIVQLLNPNMQWIIFFIFGLGMSAVVFCIYVILSIKEFISKTSLFNSYFDIREKGIIYVENSKYYRTFYEDITKIELNKRITIYCKNGKYTIHKSKNDQYIYELIQSKIVK